MRNLEKAVQLGNPLAVWAASQGIAIQGIADFDLGLLDVAWQKGFELTREECHGVTVAIGHLLLLSSAAGLSEQVRGYQQMLDVVQARYTSLCGEVE